MNILITGASKGIGCDLVKLFSAVPGNKVIGLSRNSKKLEQLKQNILTENNNFIPVSFDLLEIEKKGKPLYKEIINHIPKIDILINNAGLLINKPLQDFSIEEAENIFKVNFFSAVSLIKMFRENFSKNAHIVNIGSMGGFQGSAKFPGLSYYSASKGALAIITECLAEELKDTGIKINCLALGAVQTEMLTEAFPDYKAPLSSKDMASFIYDFANTGHQFFNGKVIPVSGSTP